MQRYWIPLPVGKEFQIIALNMGLGGNAAVFVVSSSVTPVNLRKEMLQPSVPDVDVCPR